MTVSRGNNSLAIEPANNGMVGVREYGRPTKIEGDGYVFFLYRYPFRITRRLVSSTGLQYCMEGFVTEISAGYLALPTYLGDSVYPST